jgi:mannose-6-phosphate isomerase class I
MLPVRKTAAAAGKYDIYPCFHLPGGQVSEGFASLALRLSGEKRVIVDGYCGVFFEHFRKQLTTALQALGIAASWTSIDCCLKPPEEIDRLISPFLGGDDPLFGTRATLEFADLFNENELTGIFTSQVSGISFIYGPGAALCRVDGFLVYIDLPKNELQYRARTGSVTNLGAAKPSPPKSMYKRFYFVDWVVLNRHKHRISGNVDIVIDGQRPDEPLWMEGKAFREAMSSMARSPFRARPWFEPGAWGGHWIRKNIHGVNTTTPNYAWSFELIVPENGLVLESSGLMFEVSFDWLMFLEAKAVLGNANRRYGTEFPIRFDFLDTYDGGNLSIQCHPQTDYINKNFGENFTQQEAYYILDTKDNALVNLGFCEDIHPREFRRALEESAADGIPVDIPKFVQAHTARKHDLFLIPDGTIHGSGANNLVLEISTTPYIFTFKLYDWLRPDLDGNPRDLNIQRGFENLCFDRKGDKVRKELISQPRLIRSGEDWQLFHLPTHPLHLYDVHRYHFRTKVFAETGNDCHVLSLVGGTSILVRTPSMEQRFSYAETFIVPAAAGSYEIINESEEEAIVVIAFMKRD